MKPDARVLFAAVGSGATPRDAAKRIDMNHKRMGRLCEKWAARGLYDYGVSLDLGWLTVKGRELLALLSPSPQPPSPPPAT